VLPLATKLLAAIPQALRPWFRGPVAALINAGKIAEAADEFDKYIYGTVKDGKTGKNVKVVLDGLVARREAEKRLFLGE
jgi:GH24 family phage-related lysozyme (muramidase)